MKALFFSVLFLTTVTAHAGDLLEQHQLSPEYRALSVVSLKEEACNPNPEQSVFFATEVFGEDRLLLKSFVLEIYSHDFSETLRHVKIHGSTMKIDHALEISFTTTVEAAQVLVESWAAPAENSYFWLTSDAACSNATTHFVSDYSVQRLSQ